MSSKSILDHILGSIKKKDFRELSQGIEQLRSNGLLTDVNKVKINGWIDEYLPSSSKDVAKSLLEEDDEEEKELEEKIPTMHPRNVCSSDTQKDLVGESISPLLDRVITFLLPKSKKSECITESDMMKIVAEREDELYLYSSKNKTLIKSVMVYRLPTSGIWIVGNPMYFLLFRSYQLESFGKHIISAETHRVGSIWRQEHELFLAKPLHWNDLTAFIRDNTVPSSTSSCACMFKPEKEDWSVQAKTNLPINECQWMVPTWNGVPVFFGETCGEVLNWNSDQLFESYVKFPTSFLEIYDFCIKLTTDINNSITNVYVETEESNAVLIQRAEWRFTWQHFSISNPKLLGEVAARVRKWPTEAILRATLKVNIIAGFPIRLIFTDGSILKSDQITNGPTKSRFDFGWNLNILDPLPPVPSSLLPSSLRQLLILLQTIIVNVDTFVMVQDDRYIEITAVQFWLIYADNNTDIIHSYFNIDTRFQQIIQKMASHGPLIELLCHINLGTKLANNNPVHVEFPDDKIMLPSIKPEIEIMTRPVLRYALSLTE